MSSNVQVKFTADIADLKVNMAAAEAVMKQTAKAANEASKAVAMGDSSDAGRAKLLATTQAALDAKGAFNGLSREYKELTAAEKDNTSAGKQFLAQLKDQAATAGMSQKQMLAYRAEQLGVAADAQPLIASLKEQTGHMVSNRAATEGLVLIHEAMSGRYTRMAGSAMIMTQAMIGSETISKALAAAMTPLGAAVLGTAVAAGIAGYSMYQYEAAQRELLATTVGLGASSGLTADQLQAAGEAAARYSGQSVSASRSAAEAFAAAGVRSAQTIAGLTSTVQTYAALTGQDAADAQKALAEAMRDPIKGAQTLNEQLSLLDATQMTEIRTAMQQGDQTRAVSVIMEALTQRTDEARTAGVGANTTWQTMTSTASDLAGMIGHAADEMIRFAIASGRSADVAMADNLKEADRQARARQATANIQTQAQEKAASARGSAVYDATPAGQDAAKRAELTGAMKTAQAALAADTALHGAHSDAVQHDQAALAAYKRAIDTYLPSAEKAHELAVLDQQIAEARKGRDSGRVADLTRKKAEIDTAGEVMSPDDAAQRANDAAATAGAKTAAPKKPHDDQVAKWSEELHEMEIASQDYFADQTQKELTFWQGKVAAASKSQKDLLAVQAHIFEASKALARQDYADHIADLNERIAADKSNWAKEQADIQEKATFIKSKQGEQAREYKHALQEQETAQRDHDAKTLAEVQRAAKEQTDELKRSLEAQQRAREDNAKVAEIGIKSKAGATPFGDIKADQQIAAQQQQLTQQKLADNETLHAAEAARLDAAVEAAKAKYADDKDAYAAAIAAKKAEDQRYADAKRTLDAQLQLEQAQSVQQMQAKYTSYIQGTVNATVSGLDKMISGQMTWKNFGISVYQSVAREAEQQVVKMATTWIVQHLLMGVASKALSATTAATGPAQVAATAATSKAQVAALAGLAGAGGVASMAAAPWPMDMTAPEFGATMQAAAISMGSFAQGTNFVPRDMVAQIHAGERIIPKADNDTLINLAARGAGAAGSSPGGGGDTHYHVSSHFSGQEPLRDQLLQHEDTIISIMQTAVRRGVRFR